ncbi:MAG TPA: protein kinase [Anaerolineales bacterium]|nr:protein kinase [Anaerolineales bacterium]
MISLTGKQLGAYQIVERIDTRPGSDAARPSESRVYRATPSGGGEAVAIKVFSANPLSPESRTRLRDSLRVVSQLRHSGAAPILGSGVVEGQPYIVMPYFTAGSLADRYERGLASSLDPSELLNELSAVLDVAHQRGIVHGSLRPSSLLFDPESGSVRLVGLGESVGYSTEKAQTAAAGAIYAAPEVTAGQDPTPGADQYSFGVVAAEMLTGLPAEHALGYLRARSVGRPYENRNLRTPLTAQTLLALSKATAAAPGARFATVGEANRSLQIALGKLAPVIAPEPAEVPEAPRIRPRRRRAAAAVFVVLLLALVGIVPALAAGLIELPSWAGGSRVGATSDGQLSSGPTIMLPTENQPPTGPGDPGYALGGESTTPSVGDAAQPVSGVGSTVTDPLNPTATPDAGSQLPGPTSSSAAPTPTNPAPPTSAPTSTPPPTVAPTNPPPTAPGIKKCKDDPAHPNYCTPTPSP